MVSLKGCTHGHAESAQKLTVLTVFTQHGGYMKHKHNVIPDDGYFGKGEDLFRNNQG